MHPDVITTSIWDEPGTVDLLKAMWLEGASAAEIAAAIGQGVTRNGVIGKVHRLNLPKRLARVNPRNYRVTRDTTPLITGKKGRSGNPGVPSVQSIKYRAQGRAKIRAREIEDEGVDATHLIAFRSRKIGKECAYIPGDPLDGAMCCGKPVVEGGQWCEEHRARVYSGRAAL